MGDEHLHYSAGNEKLVVDLKGWKIMPLICYDLRFPVWSKNTFHNGEFAYDLLIYVANWPAIRAKVWETLLQARAIENMAFAAGVNRIGRDGRGFDYSGNSLLASPEGEIKSRITANMEQSSTVHIQFEELENLRKKLGAGHDWDSFILE
jgi:predicted amidohydrolase